MTLLHLTDTELHINSAYQRNGLWTPSPFPRNNQESGTLAKCGILDFSEMSYLSTYCLLKILIIQLSRYRPKKGVLPRPLTQLQWVTALNDSLTCLEAIIISQRVSPCISIYIYILFGWSLLI